MGDAGILIRSASNEILSGADGGAAEAPNLGGEGGMSSLGDGDSEEVEGKDDEAGGGEEATGAAIGMVAAGLGGGMLTGTGEFPRGWG